MVGKPEGGDILQKHHDPEDRAASPLHRDDARQKEPILVTDPYAIRLSEVRRQMVNTFLQDSLYQRVDFGGQLLLEFELSQQVRGGRIKKENLPLEIDNEDRIGK